MCYKLWPQFVTPWWRKPVPSEIVDKIIYIPFSVWLSLFFLICKRTDDQILRQDPVHRLRYVWYLLTYLYFHFQRRPCWERNAFPSFHYPSHPPPLAAFHSTPGPSCSKPDEANPGLAEILIDHLRGGVILLPRPECFVKTLSHPNLSPPWEERDNWKISLTIEATNRILVLVVKWRHHADGLF